jgi:hypothetical protein
VWQDFPSQANTFTQTINKKVYVYYLGFGCVLRTFMELIWDMDKACVLRTSNLMLQALGDVVERSHRVFFFSEKMTSLENFDMIFVFCNVFGQYLTIQLRTANLKTNSGQQGCVLRLCVLFY